MSKLVVVLGPTATGKTKLAVNIAYQYNGEIISADSRQIYRGMDIGTGKDLDEYYVKGITIPYHLIDILNPINDYSVFQFKQDFWGIYNSLKDQKKIPIVCGGTGLYIESILLNYQMSLVPPNSALRLQLENKTIDYLKNYLIDLDSTIYNQNYHITKRRLIRSIEISSSKEKDNSKNMPQGTIPDPLVIGLQIDREKLLIRIRDRLEKRMKSGMIQEVKSLIDNGIDMKRLKYFGLEYKYIGEYLYNQIGYDQMFEKLNYAINRFSKRQMTFFRRMEKRGINILWISIDEYKAINQYVYNYLEK
tara:strand:- start:1867 stop:2781 length:915 start_codon:yes stop_codon:yes gene_type:complete